MRIHQDFVGGNIEIVEQQGNTFFLKNQLRGTAGDWFYWAFCVEGAENQEYTFRFGPKRVGYYGPAVSHDLLNWKWLESNEEDSFTYHFTENETKVYFAHSMLYHPDRFFAFAKKHKMEIQELCKGYKGSSVPYITFGNGEKSVILTARHHACESTGNFVLEGVLEELLTNPIKGIKVLCVPFVDYEGVIRGEQGKARAPHDHNQDYDENNEAIYPECRAIKEYARENGCHFGFDFHSPGHKGKSHDHVFIVQNKRHFKAQEEFGKMFEQSLTPEALIYRKQDDFPPGYGWNQEGPMFGYYMNNREENHFAFTLETPYFGLPNNRVTDEKMVEMGRCFARAFRKYLQ